MKIESKTYLEEFEAWLQASGLKEKTIQGHLDNVSFYLDTYLPQMSAQGIEDSWSYVDDFLGYFFIRKCAWSTPATIRQNAASLKKFYKCMLEKGHVSQEDYDELLATIKEGMSDWVAECEDFNNPGDDGLADLLGFGPGDGGLFDAAYAAVARSLGLDDLLGVAPDDVDEDDLPTRQETVRELTLALFYLTSWQEEPLKGSGVKVRRAWKSADWDAVDWLREEGFIDCTNKAKSVYLTDEGTRHAEETLTLMGLGHLVEDEHGQEPRSGRGFKLVD